MGTHRVEEKMDLSKKARRGFRLALAACGAVSAIAMGFSGAAMAADEPATTGGDLVVRRMSAEQYRQIVGDIFGPSIKLGGRFEPDARTGGLIAVGAGKVSISSTGLEQYDAMAREVAAQVVDERHRDMMLPCKPAKTTEPDDACAGQFISKIGRMLYRRPLSPQEVQLQVKAASEATKSLKDFYSGLRLSMADMMVAPQFLFRQEVAEPDPAHSGAYRLNSLSKATQLSFFFWNSSPDMQLLAAAESGELNSEKGLNKQVDRLLNSPRLEAGVRAFFGDMLQFDQFESLTKDAAIYPKFTPEVTRDAQEQTMRTIVDHLLTRKGDYRDLYTTRQTFLTPLLGTIYKLPLAKASPNGAPATWVSYEFPQGDARGAGILTQASFVALHSHPGRSSPTLRGKALREILLCQKVPDPPGNVNFTVVQDTANPKYRTTRERVTAHRTDPTCAGCHKLIDPMGLALENFDGGSSYRQTENGASIDASGELDGVKFSDAIGLGKAMHDHPATPSCLVNRLYSYAAGRVPAKGESEFIKYLEKDFAANGYKLPELMRRIATSDALYHVSPPQTGALEVPTSRLASQTESLQGSGR